MNRGPEIARTRALRKRLALSTALASMAFVGYGTRGAYAGSCVQDGALGVYLCSGAANAVADVPQILPSPPPPAGTPLTVTTAPGFGIDTSTGGAGPFDATTRPFTLVGDGGLTFTDTYNSVIAGGYGSINARNLNSGALSITTTGQVSAEGGSAILATNYGSGLTVTSTDVTSGGIGVQAVNRGAGDLSVTVSGTVSSIGSFGIFASGDASNEDVTVSAGAVSGRTGITATNAGSGDVNITATGLVTGTAGAGLSTVNSGRDLTVSTAAVTGFNQGIVANHRGTGALAITSTGTVEGTNRDGFRAQNTYGTDLTVTTTAVSGGLNGLIAYNFGTGAVSVTATGPVTAGGGYGLFAYNTGLGDLTVSVADVSGTSYGIAAVNANSAGVLSVTVSGAVSGGTGAGIYTGTRASAGSTVITLNAGASAESTFGSAIVNDQGDSISTVNTGASITGEVRLNNGSDDLTFDGGDFSNVSVFDGGDDASSADGFVDKLTFKNVSGSLDGDKAVNWETVAIGSGGNISLDNTLNTELVEVTDGGSIGGTGTINGNLVIAAGGAGGPGNSPGDLTVNGDFALDAGASLFLEVEGTSLGEFDRLLVSGDLFLEGDIEFELATGIDENTFLTEFDVFDFIVDIDPIVTLAFDISQFDDANYFLQSINGTFDLLLNDDGTFSLGSRASVPEPGALALFAAGLFGLIGLGWRRRHGTTA
ncbi:MAG: PEP-CTERM sorting domain-containing protein [Alphaproteobacteria bacterium]|nr:PEP-CTERM sorting domain-containing protein [Alphaproteobacteria bacterium]